MPESQFTTEELLNEIWKPIPGFEGYYSASNIGRIRRDKGGKGATVGAILRQQLNRNGYLQIILTVERKARRIEVHQLIARAFIGPRPPGYTVNHKKPKTGKTNNRADNLEYRTHQGQMEHAKEHGLMPSGDKHWSHRNPDLCSRGDRHGSRTHPERVPRGETHYKRRKATGGA